MSESPWLSPVRPEVVWFSGGDALRFLNDLISQEIADLDDGETRRSFLLGPQGKLDFLLWVIRSGDSHGLVTEPGRGDELAVALGRYRIRVDVDIEVESADVWIVMGEWDGFDVSWVTFRRTLGVGSRPDLREGTAAEYERARVEAGEPFWGVDVDDRTIPHESGLVSVSVDFDKGCFLGQELVARVDSRGGNVPRHLRHLESVDGRALAPGGEVLREGETVGRVSSSAGPIALAMVHRSVETGETVDVEGVRALVRPLPAEIRPDTGAG